MFVGPSVAGETPKRPGLSQGKGAVGSEKSQIPLTGTIGSVVEQANTEERMDCRCDVSCRIKQQALRLQLEIERKWTGGSRARQLTNQESSFGFFLMAFLLEF